MMRKWLAAAAALLLVPLVAGCAQEAPELQAAEASASSSRAEETVEETAPAVVQTVEAVSTQRSEAPLTEDQVLSAYTRAVAAYEWFDLCTMPAAGAGVSIDGSFYQKVDYAGIETLEELKTYLRGLFSQEIVDRLLPKDAAAPLYRDIDGALYELPASREADAGKGERTVAVEQESDEAYMVNVTVETLGDDLETVTGVECYAFPYELVDGRWVFTDFELVD